MILKRMLLHGERNNSLMYQVCENLQVLKKMKLTILRLRPTLASWSEKTFGKLYSLTYLYATLLATIA